MESAFTFIDARILREAAVTKGYMVCNSGIKILRLVRNVMFQHDETIEVSKKLATSSSST